MTRRESSTTAKPTGETEPFWKRLFAPGGFEWAFRMRKGDARPFFAPQDASGALLNVRNRILDENPDRYLYSTNAGDILTRQVYLRLEHQLFTGLADGVLMGIRIETFPLKDLATDHDGWKTAYEKLRSMPDDVAKYKSMDAEIPKMLEVMDAYQPLGL